MQDIINKSNFEILRGEEFEAELEPGQKN